MSNPNLDKYVEKMDKLTIKVTQEEADMILAALADQPYKVVAKVINEVFQQVTAQRTPPTPPTPPK